MANDVETFLKYLLERSEEIGIHQENRGDSETFLSEILLVHVDLLGKTVQFLHEIANISSLDHQDAKKWKKVENVYSEVEKEFINLHNHCNYDSVSPCELPLSIVDTKGPGGPCFYIPRDVLLELRGLNFSWSKISKLFGVSRWTVMCRVQEYGLSELQQFSDISADRIDAIIKTTCHDTVPQLASHSCQAIFIH